MPIDEGALRRTLNTLGGLLSHRTRLGICVLLSRHTALTFSRLKEILEETDGSLGAQLKKLEDEGFITVKKEFIRRKPVSWYSITEKGRLALEGYLEAVAKLRGS